MPGRAVHFALEDDEVARLLAAESDEERLDVLTEELEEELFSRARDRVHESDKAWYAIHLALAAAAGRGESLVEVELAFLGGEDLYHRDDYVMTLTTPAEVRRAGQALQAITEADFQALYEGIPDDDYGDRKSQDDLRYTWGYFRTLADFLTRAGEVELSVLFTVDP